MLQTDPSVKLYNHGEGPYSFSWLKAATTAFTFKSLLRHYATYAKQAKCHMSLMIVALASQSHIFLPWGQCLFSIVSLYLSIVS